MTVLDELGTLAGQVVDTAGALGLGVVMALEAVLPIPSEVVLPLVGTRVSAGQLGLLAVVLAATAGSTAGAWFVHTLGRLGGRHRVQRWARHLGITPTAWARTEAHVARHGDWVVLLGRLVPGLRCAVSLPAGAMGMPVGRFLVLTAAGSAVWNAAWIGGAAWLVTHGAEVLAALADARPAVLTAVLAGTALVLGQQTASRAALR